MKLNLESVNQLSSLLNVCSAVGIESAVLSEGKFRGISPNKTVAILTDSNIALENDATLGIGRINELGKRLDLFSGKVEIDATINNRGEISQLMIGAGKSKTNFRCTSEKVIRYPKTNEDTPIVTLTFNKEEMAAVIKAKDALKAAHVVVHCDKNEHVKIECVEDSTNDVFTIDIEAPARFIDDNQGCVWNFMSKDFSNAASLALKNSDSLEITFGAVSATMLVNNHTLVLLSQLTGEEDDE